MVWYDPVRLFSTDTPSCSPVTPPASQPGRPLGQDPMCKRPICPQTSLSYCSTQLWVNSLCLDVAPVPTCTHGCTATSHTHMHTVWAYLLHHSKHTHIYAYTENIHTTTFTLLDKSFRTPTHSRVFRYFYYQNYEITHLESCSNQKSVKQIKIYVIFEILQSSHPYQLCTLLAFMTALHTLGIPSTSFMR